MKESMEIKFFDWKHKDDRLILVFDEMSKKEVEFWIYRLQGVNLSDKRLSGDGMAFLIPF